MPATAQGAEAAVYDFLAFRTLFFAPRQLVQFFARVFHDDTFFLRSYDLDGGDGPVQLPPG
jgi:hypothetical protein